MNERIILASASPRRKELLRLLYDEFEIMPSDVSEATDNKEAARAVEYLSNIKAKDVVRKILQEPDKHNTERSEDKLKSAVNGNAEWNKDKFKNADSQKEIFKTPGILKHDEKPVIIIACDTLVAVEGTILGKPSDEKDAFRMLKRLESSTHQVYTGVTIIRIEDGKASENIFSEKTDVEFYPMTDDEIKWYISTGEPMDKAGAYGIQGLGGRFVKGIKGDYNNVVGLPISALYTEMKKICPLT